MTGKILVEHYEFPYLLPQMYFVLANLKGKKAALCFQYGSRDQFYHKLFAYNFSPSQYCTQNSNTCTKCQNRLVGDSFIWITGNTDTFPYSRISRF